MIFSTPRSAQAASNAENNALSEVTSVVTVEPRRDLGEPDEVAEDDGDVVVSVGDQLLAAIEPLDDRLGEDVEQKRMRARLLDGQLVVDAVERLRVRVAVGIDLFELVLEPPDPPSEAGDLPVQRLGRDVCPEIRVVAHVPSSSVTNVSLK